MRRLPSLNALRAFEAAARHQSFTRAAEELNVSQGAVSHQVKLLEAQLGMKLFRRSALEQLLPHVRSNGFAFDVEVLASATTSGMRIEEGPVHALAHFVPTRRPLDLARIMLGVGRLAVLRARMSSAVETEWVDDTKAVDVTERAVTSTGVE